MQRICGHAKIRGVEGDRKKEFYLLCVIKHRVNILSFHHAVLELMMQIQP
jgi:hypothetical protein